VSKRGRSEEPKKTVGTNESSELKGKIGKKSHIRKLRRKESASLVSQREPEKNQDNPTTGGVDARGTHIQKTWKKLKTLSKNRTIIQTHKKREQKRKKHQKKKKNRWLKNRKTRRGRRCWHLWGAKPKKTKERESGAGRMGNVREEAGRLLD